MKIGFEDTPAAPAGTYSRHLAELLAEYAPEHEYIAVSYTHLRAHET